MNAKTKRFYFDYAIMFIIMIGAHFVPTVSTITPFGMQVLGIFVALLYGWTTQGTLLPSLIGMVALFATKSISVTDFWAQGFGSTTVVFMVLIFIYMALVDSSGVMAFMANWFVTRKFVSGRPWILSATLLLGCFYTAALANASKELEEAATMDGANLLQQIWYVELPAIKNIIVIQFILQAGNIMSIGFEKAYALQTDMNLPASEILSTYVYRIGLLNGDYGYSTAVGLFNSVVNVILLIFVNCVVKKLNDGEGL